MDIISQFQDPATLSPEKELVIPTEQKVRSTLDYLSLAGNRASSSSVAHAVHSHYAH